MCCSSHFPQKNPKVFTRKVSKSIHHKISKSIQNYSPEKFAKVYKSIHQKNSPEEFRNGSVGAWSVGIVPSTHFVMITCVLFFRNVIVIIIVILWLWLLLLGFAFQPLHLELPQLFPFLQCVDVVLLLLFCNVIVIILWLLVFAFQKLHPELPSPFPFLQCVNVVLYRYYHFVLLLFFPLTPGSNDIIIPPVLPQ